MSSCTLISDTINYCSSNGYLCLEPFQGCVCNDHWSHVSDFSPEQDYESPYCVINTTIITALASVSLIASVICSILIIRYLSVRLMERKSLSEMYHGAFNLKFAFPTMFLGVELSMFVYAVLKLCPENYSVGSNLLVTLALAFSNCFLFVGRWVSE